MIEEIVIIKFKDAGIHTKYSNDFCYCFFGIDSNHNQGSFSEG